MKYAVIASGGKQYKVSEGDIILVDHIEAEAQSSYTFPEVLLFVDEKAQIGAPSLSDITVSGKVLEQTKGEKIRVSKFKAKAKYRRTTGFRASLTKIQIESIAPKTKKSEK